MDQPALPCLGFGMNCSFGQLTEILATQPIIDWLEVEPDLMFNEEGKLRILEEVAEQYPLVLHCLDISIGNATPLDWEFLKKLKKLTKKVRSPWVSDHLGWGKLPHTLIRGALPLPFHHDVVRYVAEKARILQDYLEVPFALENITTLFAFQKDQMPEWEFFCSVIEQAGIRMLLDLNNLYVSSRNLGFDPRKYCSHLPLNKVIEVHMGNCTDKGEYFVTSIDGPVHDEVWKMYTEIHPHVQHASILFEQAELPLSDCYQEIMKIKAYANNTAPSTSALN